MDTLSYTPVEFNWLHTLAKTFISPARHNQFIQENNFNNAPVQRSAIAMKTNYAFSRSYTQNPFWHQQFDLRQVRILRGCQPIVDFDAAHSCRFYVIQRKQITFKMIYAQLQLIISKTTMYYCLM